MVRVYSAFFCILLSASALLAADIPSSASAGSIPDSCYLAIEKKALAWVDGMFGSTKFCENELSALCDASTGSRIVSPYSYVIVTPYDTGKVSFRCSFVCESWLEIEGYVDRPQFAKLHAAAAGHSGMWRSAALVSISGKIKKFRLDSSSGSKRLILFLDGVEFRTRIQDSK